MLDSKQILIRHLIERRTISEADVSVAHSHASEQQAGLIRALVETGRLSHRDLALARARVSGVPYVDLSRYTVALENASLLPQRVAERYTAFPIFVVDGVASVAVIDPLDLVAIDAIQTATHHEIDPIICDEDAILKLIQAAYSQVETGTENATDPAPKQSRGSATPKAIEPIPCKISFVQQTVLDAIAQNASGIHICSADPDAPLRFRVAGSLKTHPCADADPEARVLVEQIKALAGMEPSHVRTPQRAQVHFAVGSENIEAILSVIPTAEGEDIFVKFIERPTVPLEIAGLGMPADVESFFRKSIEIQAGVVLVTGRIGSGKSTTIEAALRARASVATSTLVIACDTQSGIPGVRHVCIDPASGLNTAGMIRAASRHDPDILAVGDICDADSAHAAFEAASRGCLVLASMHAARAHAAIDRLGSFGLAPDQIESDLIGVINQWTPGQIRVAGATARIEFEALPMTPGLARPRENQSEYAAWLSRCAQTLLGSAQPRRNSA